jgi:hypothetical protein
MEKSEILGQNRARSADFRAVLPVFALWLCHLLPEHMKLLGFSLPIRKIRMNNTISHKIVMKIE